MFRLTFADHVVGRNLWPLFRHHDPQAFEVFCYADVLKPDETTKHFRQRADQWRDTAGLSDEVLARLIHEDAVDIPWTDPAHGGQPAADVCAPTGADADKLRWLSRQYRIGCDSVSNPADRYLDRRSEMGDRRFGSELRTPNPDLRSAERIFLIDSFWCYDPCEGDLLPNDLPAHKSGCVTFASLNNFCKVNEPLLRLWAKVLNKVENSALILLSGQGSHRQRTWGNPGPGRGCPKSGWSLSNCARGEVIWSSTIEWTSSSIRFPTTATPRVWMPCGWSAGGKFGRERSVSRAGLSQLSNVGLPELAAFSEDDYVLIAAHLASDLPRLEELRSTLRLPDGNAPLMDAPRFARAVEAAYRIDVAAMVCRNALTVTMTVQQTFAVAVQHHQAGRLGDAEALYRQILGVQPGHAEAMHCLGVIAHQAGRHDLAVKLIRHAPRPRSEQSQGSFQSGRGASRAGPARRRHRCSARGHSTPTHYPEAFNSLVSLLARSGRFVEAYHRAIQLRPDYQGAYFNLGIALAAQARFEEAVVAYDQCLQGTPGT